MGVDVRAMLYVGKWVENAGDYFISKGLITEDELEDAGGDFDELLDFPFDVQQVSYYYDEGYYIGFNVSPKTWDLYGKLMTQFKAITGDDAELCQFVQWY